MDEHELLIRHARAWAETKSRDLDEEILSDALWLREQRDELGFGVWPAGSAERLLLTTWPAYAPNLPDLTTMQNTLDTFWSFLRATGRMSSQSASPADLRKEAKRALPKMQMAYDDPANHSISRVLSDFGESIGLSLQNAHSTEEAQQVMGKIQEAWNALPQEERLRRMPDPDTKGNVAADFAPVLDNLAGAPEADEDALPEFVPSEPHLSARDARESAYLQKCLELREWLGSGKQATSRGLLKPAVAREAYADLGLDAWDRGVVSNSLKSFPAGPIDPSGMGERVLEQRKKWRSAGDCLALDRLWFPMTTAELIEWSGTRAWPSDALPETDEGWVTVTLMLLMVLTKRLDAHHLRPLEGLLLILHEFGGTTRLDAIRDWWRAELPPELYEHREYLRPGILDDVLFHYSDCNVWRIDGDQISITDLGRDFTIAFLNTLEAGVFDD